MRPHPDIVGKEREELTQHGIHPKRRVIHEKFVETHSIDIRVGDILIHNGVIYLVTPHTIEELDDWKKGNITA